MEPDVTVVIAAGDRHARLLRTLARLAELPERPPVVVVANGSPEAMVSAVRAAHPAVALLHTEPLGPAARTIGALAARTPLVAFCDDDSWWAPGALARAAAHFAAHPQLGLLAARIVVEPGSRLDPTCAEMAASPLRAFPPLPGPPVLGFLACGAVVRRRALLASGGFPGRFGFGGEEEVVAVDLAAAGWGLAYAGDVVAHHAPQRGPRPGRERVQARNRLWSLWLRRPWARAVGPTLSAGPRTLAAALRGLPWVLRERHALPAHVEGALRALGR
jgi:N-acetylglucosaminyl-diphospho-decaprenol L-rhamnosyltransferase